MENKYYTPKIEEFRVGFEYEIHTATTKLVSIDFSKDTPVEPLGSFGSFGEVWEKAKMTSTTSDTGEWITMLGDEGVNTYTCKAVSFPSDHRSLEQIASLLKSGQIRVKYLDREDIENLGFGDYKRAVCHWYKMEGHFKDGFGEYGKWSKIRLLHCKDLNTIKIKAFEHSWDEEETVLFQGKIKNKSELKILFKQLNITKDGE